MAKRTSSGVASAATTSSDRRYTHHLGNVVELRLESMADRFDELMDRLDAQTAERGALLDGFADWAEATARGATSTLGVSAA